MCLLGIAQLLKPRNQIGHHHPHFLFTMIFEGYLLLITQAFKNPVSQRYLMKKDVVCSNVEAELS